MKLEKEIDGNFPSLGEDNPFTANAQTLQAGTGMQEELIELQHDGFARDVHSEKNLGDFGLRCANRIKELRNLLFKHCCCFHQHGCVNRHFQ